VANLGLYPNQKGCLKGEMNKQVNKHSGEYMDEEIDDMVSGGIETMHTII
jgi:hypothetical protein